MWPLLRALPALLFALSVAGLSSRCPAQAPALGQPPGTCGTCIWDSGPFDQRTAQTAITGTYNGDLQTADDVYIRPWETAHVSRITAILVGDSIIPKARLRIYEDCDGLPGTLLLTQDTTQLTPTGQVYSGLRVFLADFALTNLWLPGGNSGRTYWVSISGIGATATDHWFWASAGAGQTAGRPGLFRSAAPPVSPWTSVADLACGCTDFALRLEGECCEVLWDNGPAASPAGGTLSMLGPGSVEARAADDFVVPGCGDVTVCALHATLYSNCLPLTGRFEIFADNCTTPQAAPVAVVPFTRAVDLGYSVTIGGVSLRAHRVEALNPSLTLAAGRTYWLSAIGRAAGGIQQRTLLAWASDCAQCSSRLSPALATAPAVPGPTPPVWRPVDQAAGLPRSLQFSIAIKKRTGVPIIIPPACPADINLNGIADIDDIFGFLSAWFGGCP